MTPDPWYIEYGSLILLGFSVVIATLLVLGAIVHKRETRDILDLPSEGFPVKSHLRVAHGTLPPVPGAATTAHAIDGNSIRCSDGHPSTAYVLRDFGCDVGDLGHDVFARWTA